MTASRAARVETPADTLRRAAAKVRELVEEATCGPWETSGHDGNHERGIPPEMCVQGVVDPNPRLRSLLVVASGISDDDYEDESRDYLMPGDAAWIAMLGPQIAEPLAAWLDYVVERMSVYDEEFEADGGTVTYALALARALLDSPVPEPDGEGTA